MVSTLKLSWQAMGDPGKLPSPRQLIKRASGRGFLSQETVEQHGQPSQCTMGSALITEGVHLETCVCPPIVRFWKRTFVSPNCPPNCSKILLCLQEYKPAKLKIGCPHPDPVVESNSLMSVDPPELPYQEVHHLQVSIVCHVEHFQLVADILQQGV